MILCVVALFAAPAASFAQNEWTVIVYMVNDDKDTTLENANFKNLNDMKYYGAGENHTILVQMDGMSSGSSDPQLPHHFTARILT